MTDLAVVTGAGTGLGRAIAKALVSNGVHVLGIGRRVEPLETLRDEVGEGVEIRATDIGTPEGREGVLSTVASRPVKYLINNAGILEPVGPLSEVSLRDWHYIQAVNVEAPLFLTKDLLNNLRGGGRVLSVSSGAAHRPIAGWGAYCTTKAALFMVYQILRDELADYDIAVGSLRPGVVDTPMQALIREQSTERFPGVERFRELKAQGQLADPDDVARYALKLLTETDAETFSSKEWEYT